MFDFVILALIALTAVVLTRMTIGASKSDNINTVKVFGVPYAFTHSFTVAVAAFLSVVSFIQGGYLRGMITSALTVIITVGMVYEIRSYVSYTSKRKLDKTGQKRTAKRLNNK